MCAETPDYKETLNLPKTDFPMRAGLPKKELEWLQRWERLDIYQKLRKKEGRKPYILHDGPPYSNGHLHIGHALNKILKDMVVRSQQMMGRDALYIPGWDCHGLPIEWKIEESYRHKGKNKDEIPILDFRHECRTFAEKWVDIQKKEFKRLGVIGNWGKPYLTMSFHAEKVIAEELMKFLKKGILYQGSKPVMWSPVEKTALAEAEIEYFDHKSHTIWVPFSFRKSSERLRNTRIVIWTTTPWTIPSNKAVAFNPKIEYGLYLVKKTDEESWTKPEDQYVLADNLASECLEKSRVTDFSRIRTITPDELTETVLEHPFAKLDSFWSYDVPMIEGDHVNDETGTGFVHTAPSHGAEDFECFVSRGWTEQMTHNIGVKSEFLPHVPFFANLEVFDHKGKEGKANQAVIAKLVEAKSIIGRGRLTHSYPHSWRSKAPVIFRNTPQWFAAIDVEILDDKNEYGKTIRERALNSIDKLVEWTPKTGRNRLYSMIESRPDWVLSRQRAWGVPITCFTKKGALPTDENFLLRNSKVNSRIAEAFETEGADAWYKEGAKERFLSGLEDPSQYEQIFDILDVWFDSGSSHAFVLRDREDGSKDGLADLYLEGTDQHRGWFHSSILQSCGTQGRAPYRGVLTHGFALDENGMKMSKSLGNTTSPDQVIKQYGADILRLWVAQSDYSADIRIGPEILKNTSDSYRRLRNTMRFILGSLDQFSETDFIEPSDMPELEKWVLHRLTELDSVVRSGYAVYDFQGVFQSIFAFATVDLSSFYFDVRKDVLYCDGNTIERRSSRTVLDILFHHLTTWLAPILSFTMEEVWLERYPSQENSVHLVDFPKTPTEWKNDLLAQKWQKIRTARRVVTAALEISRTEKIIGSSLEAAPTVYIKNQDMLNALTSVPFQEICITSDIDLQLGDAPENSFKMEGEDRISVVFNKADGQKCLRCWKILRDVGTHKNAATCDRCNSALDQSN